MRLEKFLNKIKISLYYGAVQIEISHYVFRQVYKVHFFFDSGAANNR